MFGKLLQKKITYKWEKVTEKNFLAKISESYFLITFIFINSKYSYTYKNQGYYYDLCDLGRFSNSKTLYLWNKTDIEKISI